MNPQRDWEQRQLILVLPALITPTWFLAGCLQLPATYSSSSSSLGSFTSPVAYPDRFPALSECALTVISFSQLRLPPIWFVASCLQFPFKYYSFSSSSGSFASPVAYLSRFPAIFEHALAAIYFSQPRLPPIGFVAGCLQFPSVFSSSLSSLGSFAVPVAYPAMFLDLCECDLAALSSSRTLSNVFSSAHAS